VVVCHEFYDILARRGETAEQTKKKIIIPPSYSSIHVGLSCDASVFAACLMFNVDFCVESSA
jgi:hypothetical protein